MTARPSTRGTIASAMPAKWSERERDGSVQGEGMRDAWTIDRRSVLAGTAAAAGSVLFGRRVRAQGAKILKAGHVEAADGSLHRAFVLMSQNVKERTGGSVDIQVYPASQLGGYRDLVQGLRLGSVDIAGGGLDYTANLVPLILTGALYYVWQSPDHAARVLQGPAGERLNQAMIEGIGVRVIGWGDFGMRGVFTRTRAVVKPADMQGLKIRVPEARHHVAAMRALGSNPAPIAYAEVYLALQNGTVDAAEGTPAAIVQQKFHEVSKHLSLTNHQLLVMHGLMGERSAAKLSASERDIVLAAARDAFQWQREEAARENAAALDQIKQAGVQVHQPDLAAFRAAVRPSWKELLNPIGADGAELIRQIEAAA